MLPILKDKCVACHNPDKISGGLVLNSYTALLEGGSSGAVIKPGDPDSSRLFLLVSHKATPHMPPKSPMIARESLDTIRAWIAGGALENAGSKAKPAGPKADIALASIVRGKPDGPPPMPSARLALDPVVKAARANAVTALAANPWSPLVAVAGQKSVLLYHSDTLDLLGVLPFPEGQVNVLKFSRNGSLLLAGGGRGGKSGRAVVWSVTTGQRVIEVGDEADAVLAADISADQQQIALGGPGKVVRVYSTRDGSLLREIKKHTDWVTSLEYSPDAVLLATGDRNGGLFVWEAFTGREYFSLRGHTAMITDLSWRHDSNALASASEDGTVRLWEMENGTNFKAWGHGAACASVQYGRDGRLVSCGRDRLAKLWDGNGAGQRTFEALPDLALRVAFSHDGGRAFCGDWTGEVRVWNTADGKPVGTLTTNPPPLPDRLAAAEKAAAVLQAAREKAAAAQKAAEAAAQKAAADLAAAQKAVADTAAAAKKAADELAKAKAAADQATAAVAVAQKKAAAKDVLAKAFAEAAAKVQEAANRAKDDAELAAAATRAKEIAGQAAAELAAAQKAANEAARMAKAASDPFVKAQQAAAQANAAAVAAPKQAEAMAAQVKALRAKAGADQAAAEQAAASLAVAQAQADRLKAALSLVKQAPK